jgi:hypothetical protein
MKEAQRKCSAWRVKGDVRSLAAARKLEASFMDHPDYESDQAYFLRIQSGESLGPQN